MGAEVVGYPKKRNQHYLPQFFLRGFANSDKKLCYLRRKQDGRLTLKLGRSSKSFCYADCLYEVKSIDGMCLFPNEIENAFSGIEDKLKVHFDRAVEDLERLPEGAVIPDGRSREIASLLSFMLAWFVFRRPEEINRLQRKASIFLEALEVCGLGSEEAIREVYSDVEGDVSSIPVGAFHPETIAKYLAYYTGVYAPEGIDGRLIEHMDLCRLVADILECTLVVLEAPSNCSFVGLDFPTNVEIHGVETHYWPITKKVAIIFFDDGRHLFERRMMTAEKTENLNGFGVLNGEWRYVFGDNESTLENLKKKLEEKSE